jgi:hypothetical protein
VRVLGHLDAVDVEGVLVLDEPGQRLLEGTDLDIEDLMWAETRVRRADAVDRFGRENDNPAVTKHRGGEIYHFR